MGKNDTKKPEEKLVVEHLGILSPYEVRALEAQESIADSLKRLADKFAAVGPAQTIAIPATDAYRRCPKDHRMQPTDAECQTCIREANARKRIPGTGGPAGL